MSLLWCDGPLGLEHRPQGRLPDSGWQARPREAREGEEKAEGKGDREAVGFQRMRLLHDRFPDLVSRQLAGSLPGRTQDATALAKWLRRMAVAGPVRLSASAATRIAGLLEKPE